MASTPAPADNIAHRFRALSRLVGNTPLLAIDFALGGERRVLYAKCEQQNFTGSIKDRMALHILKSAYDAGQIAPGAVIVEATSGNTGIAFAAIGRALGHPVVIYMPDWMSRERIDLIRSLGASIRMVSHEQGGFVACIRQAEEFAQQHGNVFLPQQFANQANVKAHALTTGPEIWWQLRHNGLSAEAFVAGVGTGGTVMGVGEFLRLKNPWVRIHPLEPAESPTLSTGHRTGSHRIQGISDEFIPPILKLDTLHDVVSVADGDGIIMAQKLASELGLAVGISSGANFLGAVMVQDDLGADAVVCTVFPDDNKKYLTTDLLRQEPCRAEYLSPKIELLGFHTIKRICQTCCELQECMQQT